MSNNHRSRFIPIITAISIVIGILIGTFYANHFSGNRLGIINTSSNKLNALLRIIDDQYVDTVNIANLVEDAMPQILAELDPHSSYIAAKDVEAANAELKGSFSGIGIQFTIQEDTIHINSVIPGGPSEKVGLMAGDRIISVEGKPFVGKIVTNQEAMSRLKGPKGSEVKIGVLRPYGNELLSFSITRGDIPVKSINASYMLNENFGYIKVDKFGETTYPELLIALAKLNQQGCKGLVLDLRGNTGGYMAAAIQMVNEFLPKNRLIVYTEGRKQPRENFSSNGTGSSQSMPIVVLVDEGSASASEIFAGAIQDNDRGLIIGRRSFGKGLVQQPIDFSDGSSIHLTIARYYTPSGRCIQKPYVKGNDTSYEMDLITRYQHGEFFSQDSIKLNKSLVYHTSLGRTVYGGGGIMPDIFVPQDTLGATSYYTTAANKGLILQFTFYYTDANRQKLLNYENEDELLNYIKKQNLLDKFASFADKKGLKRRNILMHKSHKLFEKNIYGNIIYNMLGTEPYLKYLNQSDPTIFKAIEMLDQGKSFPQPPAKVKKDAKKRSKAIAQTTDKRSEKVSPKGTTFDLVIRTA
ncbi:S41 family peptidase [Phocaeicola paurosaccharolyticus]|uniref:S41 family peptidase n=1 Tax=Phocaeicola paurosaccharolyticus TaxID=732242 RepID=UPI0004681D3C|nr:S41 family peptidase [Phocaeicola paurosaccharolyticus]